MLTRLARIDCRRIIKFGDAPLASIALFIEARLRYGLGSISEQKFAPGQSQPLPADGKLPSDRNDAVCKQGVAHTEKTCGNASKKASDGNTSAHCSCSALMR
jgi:hypothetical protein